MSSSDLIDFSALLSIGGSSATATASEACINQTIGVASFAAGSGTKPAEALNDMASNFTRAIDTPGEFGRFRVNGAGDYYCFISDGVAGVTANDEVIQLVGVTSVNGIDLTGGI